MTQKTSDEKFDPSLHLIPLDAKDRTPIILSSEKKEDNTVVAVTDNGRISFLPMEIESVFLDGEKIGKTYPLVNEIKNRIEQRFPDDKDINGNLVDQYVAVGVMYNFQEQSFAKFVFEVWGFKDHFKELDKLYEALSSIGGLTVGSNEYEKIENYLSTSPVKEWINSLISFLKEQLNWSEYVKMSLDLTIQEKEASKYAISFRGGDFKIRAKKETNLWCIDNHCQPCVIVLPQPSYNLLDSFVTEYAEKNSVAVTLGCKRLDTENPLFMPVVMSIATYNEYFIPLSKYIIDKLSPPEKMAKEFFNNVEFAKHDIISQTIKLWRQAKDLSKGDLWTRNIEGKRIEIYVTHLLKTEKSYSLKELYVSKFKSIFKI